jgi:hypothetical protein
VLSLDLARGCLIEIAMLSLAAVGDEREPKPERDLPLAVDRIRRAMGSGPLDDLDRSSLRKAEEAAAMFRPIVYIDDITTDDAINALAQVAGIMVAFSSLTDQQVDSELSESERADVLRLGNEICDRVERAVVLARPLVAVPAPPDQAGPPPSAA